MLLDYRIFNKILSLAIEPFLHLEGSQLTATVFTKRRSLFSQKVPQLPNHKCRITTYLCCVRNAKDYATGTVEWRIGFRFPSGKISFSLHVFQTDSGAGLASIQ